MSRVPTSSPAWTADGNHRLFAEYAETGCNTPVGQPAARDCAYRNHSYPQGYTTEQRWLGASMGPDSRVITLGWIDAAHDGAFKLHWGSIGSRIGSWLSRNVLWCIGRMRSARTWSAIAHACSGVACA